MGLWDFEEVKLDSNKYLENNEKGLELIIKLLSKNINNNDKKILYKLDNLLDKRLLGSVSEMRITNELDYYYKLNKLSDKLAERNKVQLLNNKTVVGVGGKFSAGKSKFINAILNDDILPEDQNPTTSIPTYIVYSEEDSIRAYTFSNQDVQLDLEAVQAITHAFYEKYKLGFSQFINNLVIKNSNIPYKTLSILDTPGYSKYDSSIKKTVSDQQKAYEQLKSVDFLIWLVDIENGVIQEKDIEFIRSLQIEQPVLIVFNKADKKSENDIRTIVQNSVEILKHENINIYGVTAYSSYEDFEYLGKNFIKKFLIMANEYKQGNENITIQMNKITNSLESQILNVKSKAINQRNVIGNIIFHSEDVLELRTLILLYKNAIEKIKDINHCEKTFKNIKTKINQMINYILR